MTGIVGTKEQLRIYGEYSDIPEKFQAAIRGGINFFELRSEKPLFFSRQIQGPFSVMCDEEFNNITQRTEFNVNWLVGDRANVRFEIVNTKTGLAKAFMPDDPWWHNRVLMTDNPSLQGLHAYHTRDGMFPGSLFREEIDMLYQEITVPAIEFVLVNALGRRLGSSFKTREEAQEEIRVNNYKNHTIQEISVRVRSPEIFAMIRRWRQGGGSRFGWTDCPEFKVIKEKVSKAFEERRGAQQAQNAPISLSDLDPDKLNAAIVRAIRQMPIAERKKLLEESSAKGGNELTRDSFDYDSMTIKGLKHEAKRRQLKLAHNLSRKAIIKILSENDLMAKPPEYAPDPRTAFTSGGPPEETEELVT